MKTLVIEREAVKNNIGVIKERAGEAVIYAALAQPSREWRSMLAGVFFCHTAEGNSRRQFCGYFKFALEV